MAEIQQAIKFVAVTCTDLNYITTIDPKTTKKPNHQDMQTMCDAMKENMFRSISREQDVANKRMSSIATQPLKENRNMR